MDSEINPSVWTRVKWVFTGQPMSDEEIDLAQAAGDPDPRTRKRFDVPWGRNVGGI